MPKQLSLDQIRRAPGSTKKRLRVGRGLGSGMGKTSRRGQKGQLSRSGAPRGTPGFEGGQTPFWRRFPKFGFNNTQFALALQAVNLDTIQGKIDRELLDPTKPITMKELVQCGALGSNLKDGVKLLARGQLRQPIEIETTRASARAIEKVEQAGGVVQVSWYTRLGLRALLKPEKFEGGIVPERARPPSKYIEYYTSDEQRGYLSPKMQMRKLGLNYVPGDAQNASE